MAREVEAERSRSALVGKQFSYQIEQQKAETAALQQSVQTLSQKYTETANAAKILQGELEAKLSQARQEVAAIEKRTQEVTFFQTCVLLLRILIKFWKNSTKAKNELLL